MKKILVTGGAGYIGSHMVYYLLNKDIDVVVLDNFSNSDSSRLKKIEEITKKKIKIVKGDVTEKIDIDEEIDAVIHFAALKSVPDSLEKPMEYYFNNVYGTLNLINWVLEKKIKKFVFSSTCAVYGDTDEELINEDLQNNPLSVYGKTKLFSEQMLEDTSKVNELSVASLRYFNVVGNLSSGEIGDNLDSPAIIPAILRSYFDKKTKLYIYGDDYKTKDGTTVRDYIHVEDLVDAHFKSLKFLEDNKGYNVFNIGTGTGYTLLELIQTCESIVKQDLNYEIKSRKAGDVVKAVADFTKAKKFLNWKPEKNLNDIFQSMLKYYESCKKV
jgi:UDP-glucose 4-epimerase